MTTPSVASTDIWPALPLESWKTTYHNLHMWTQIVGKVRLALTPRVNHWWNVPLYVTARGLTTSPIPYGKDAFEIQFDFIDHKLLIDRCDGLQMSMPLAPQTVADFYRQFMAMLHDLRIDVAIYPKPVEVPNPVPFADDHLYKAYDSDAAYRFWRILLSCDSVFKKFRARFVGKSSPVHFFWGSFDLAVTRFSGRRAPERPGADAITREAYSHEVISAGWWPGSGIAAPAFYAYAAPEPAGFSAETPRPASAFYHPDLKEFILMYDEVRQSSNPEQSLLDFLESTYESAATLAQWPRSELEASRPAA
jgi:hypothetical protein